MTQGRGDFAGSGPMRLLAAAALGAVLLALVSLSLATAAHAAAPVRHAVVGKHYARIVRKCAAPMPKIPPLPSGKPLREPGCR